MLGSKIQPRLEQSNREDSNDDEEHHTSGGTAKQFESMPADIATVNDLMEEIRAVRHLLEVQQNEACVHVIFLFPGIAALYLILE